MRLWVVVVALVLARPVSAALLTFETPDDLASLRVTYPTTLPPSGVYTAGSGVGGGKGIVSIPSNVDCCANFPTAVEPVDGVRTVSADFYLPSTSPIGVTEARCRVGFSGDAATALSHPGAGTVLFDVSGSTFVKDPFGRMDALVTLVAFDSTARFVAYAHDAPTQFLPLGRWYHASISDEIINDTEQVWGEVSDIGATGTDAPTVIYSYDAADGLSFPVSLIGLGDRYAGLTSTSIVPIDDFATPEPAASLAAIGLLALATLRRLRRGKGSLLLLFRVNG